MTTEPDFLWPMRQVHHNEAVCPVSQSTRSFFINGHEKWIWGLLWNFRVMGWIQKEMVTRQYTNLDISPAAWHPYKSKRSSCFQIFLLHVYRPSFFLSKRDLYLQMFIIHAGNENKVVFLMNVFSPSSVSLFTKDIMKKGKYFTKNCHYLPHSATMKNPKFKEKKKFLKKSHGLVQLYLVFSWHESQVPVIVWEIIVCSALESDTPGCI